MNPGGGLLAVWENSTGDVRDALLDPLGSRRGWVTDGVVELDPRDSFGNPLVVSSDVEPHALSWHDQDPTGLVYARARYLDPETGRFLSEDPVDSRNRYTYVSNDPVGQWDPYGLAAAIEYGGLNKKEAGTVEPKRRVAARIACTLFQNASAIGLLSVSMPVEIVLEGACDAAAGGPGKCFVAGTEVLTPGGSVPIEEIKPRDMVIAHGPGGPRSAIILETYFRLAGEIVEVRIAPLIGPAFMVRATPDHPFYVPAHRGYVDLRDLEPGTRLRLSDGTEAVLVSAHTRYGSQEVFNLSVAETYSYFVREEGGEGAGVLVYNGKYTGKERASDTPSWFKKCPLPPGMKSDEATMPRAGGRRRAVAQPARAACGALAWRPHQPRAWGGAPSRGLWRAGAPRHARRGRARRGATRVRGAEILSPAPPETGMLGATPARGPSRPSGRRIAPRARSPGAIRRRLTPSGRRGALGPLDPPPGLCSTAHRRRGLACRRDGRSGADEHEPNGRL